MQRNSRKVGPEVQSALAAKQQAEQWQDMEPLQEQFEGFRKTLDQQRAAAQKLQEVGPALPRPAHCRPYNASQQSLVLLRISSGPECAKCNTDSVQAYKALHCSDAIR